MRLLATGLVVFTGLTTFATSDALPINDIPIQCATICGPMVELTLKCNTDSGSGNDKRHAKRRRVVAEPAQRYTLMRERQQPAGGVNREDEESREEAHRQRDIVEDTMEIGRSLESILEEVLDETPDQEAKRSFSVIIQAPTSFPAGLLSSAWRSTTIPPPAATSPPSPAPPSSKTQPSIPPLPPAATTTTTTATASAAKPTIEPSEGSGSATGVTSTMGAGISVTGTVPSAEKKPAPTGSEQQCVCLNDSFNVAKVAALCCSCMGLGKGEKNNMDIVMNTCGFSSMEYTPRDDRFAAGITVKATKPGTASSSGSKGSEAAAGGIWAVVGIFYLLLWIGFIL